MTFFFGRGTPCSHKKCVIVEVVVVVVAVVVESGREIRTKATQIATNLYW